MDLERRGHVDMLVLAVMIGDDSQQWYGYALIDRMREVSGGEFDLAEGTVYPALHRLEADGCLASMFGMVRGRRRRYYTVTDRGRALLVERQRERDALNALLDSFLATALAGRTSPRA